MFTVEERDRLREQLLARAEADETIVGAAFTGSHAVGESDRWSDTDWSWPSAASSPQR